jgi:Tfp pilus assembly protein PilX
MIPLRSRLRHEEGGWALVTAIILMSVMLATGLAFSSVVDTQQGASREQRERETAFNLAESALSAQLFSFSRPAGWPGQGYQTNPYPQCTQASTDLRCPNDAQLRSAFTSVDLDPAATWETSVRDNNQSADAEDFYDDAQTAGLQGYDTNGDGKVWVRARATAKGKTRTLVAMVRIYSQSEDVPKSALIAGKVYFHNAGNKAFVVGSGPVQVRCVPTATNLCIGNDNRVDLATQMPGSTPVYDLLIPPAITPEARQRLKQTAISNGTFYTSCGSGQPPSAAGAVVYVERGPCSWRGNGVYNSPAKPGLLIMERGLLEMKEDYYGVIYHANLDNTTAKIVDTSGNGHINGGVLVDGPGLLEVGDSKENVIFDPNAFESVKSYGSAGVIQNTWREIKSQ